MKTRAHIPLMLFLLIGLATTTRAQSDTLVKKITVGVKITPPFVMQDANGSMRGISVDLWENIAQKMGLVYEYKLYDLQELIEAVENREVDLCINPLTVTSQRLQRFDFTQPYYFSELAVALPVAEESALWAPIKNFFSIDFFRAVSLLFAVILVFGLIVWLVERNHNEQFRKNWKGIFDGIWWSAVTMTTVGYGDKAPVTLAGKVAASIWMFVAIITISGFTAGITTTLTVSELETLNIKNLDDLRRAKVGSLRGSSSQEFLGQYGISFRPFPSVDEGLEAVANGELEAFVYDKPVLRYQIEQLGYGDRLALLSQGFNTEYYSFAMPDKHELMEELNPLLIEEIESPTWNQIKNRYFRDQE